MKQLILWLIGGYLIFTNYFYFQNVVFDVYDGVREALSTQPVEYKVLSITCAFIFLKLFLNGLQRNI